MKYLTLYLTLVYYRTTNEDFVYYNTQTQTFHRDFDLPTDCNKFEMHKKFEQSEEGLKQFWATLQKDNKLFTRKNNKLLGGRRFDIFDPEYKKSDGTIGLFYRRTDNIGLTFLKRFSQFNNSKDYDKITMEEFLIYKKTYNAGVYYAAPGIYNEAWEYDFRMMYPRLLASDNFYFPTTATGYWIDFSKYKKVKNYPYGIYNCKITIHNENVKKIFMLSPEDYYTHYDLESVFKLNSVYKNSITVEALGWAYIYDDISLEQGSEIFGEWYKKLVNLKEAEPKNLIIKTISSSIWGYLTQKNSTKVRVRDLTKDMFLVLSLESEDPRRTHYILNKTMAGDRNEHSYYDLLKVGDSPQKHPFRIKPFLTAFARLHMVKALMMQLPYVVKINTDGFITTKKFPDKIKTLIFEGHGKYDVKNCQKAELLESYD